MTQPRWIRLVGTLAVLVLLLLSGGVLQVDELVDALARLPVPDPPAGELPLAFESPIGDPPALKGASVFDRRTPSRAPPA